jgi:hypothetical protein
MRKRQKRSYPYQAVLQLSQDQTVASLKSYDPGGKTTWYARETIFVVFQKLKFVDGPRHEITHIVVILTQVRIGYLKDGLFSFIQ